MQRVAFYHGKESKLPSSKVDFMMTMGWEVGCIEMDYSCNFAYTKADKFINEFRPSIVVGSSLGGLVSIHLGTRHNVPMVLLNPALNSVQYGIGLPDKWGEFRPACYALIGKNDVVVDPVMSVNALGELNCQITFGEHGHRTPLDIFSKFISEISKELNNIKR